MGSSSDSCSESIGSKPVLDNKIAWNFITIRVLNIFCSLIGRVLDCGSKGESSSLSKIKMFLKKNEKVKIKKL